MTIFEKQLLIDGTPAQFLPDLDGIVHSNEYYGGAPRQPIRVSVEEFEGRGSRPNMPDDPQATQESMMSVFSDVAPKEPGWYWAKWKLCDCEPVPSECQHGMVHLFGHAANTDAVLFGPAIPPPERLAEMEANLRECRELLRDLCISKDSSLYKLIQRQVAALSAETEKNDDHTQN